MTILSDEEIENKLKKEKEESKENKEQSYIDYIDQLGLNLQDAINLIRYGAHIQCKAIMEENKISKQISEYLTVQIALCRGYSQESGIKGTTQTDKMFWAGAIGCCDALKTMVAEDNIKQVIETNKGKDIAKELFKLTEEPIRNSRKIHLKPHCPKCLSSDLDEMGVTADGVKSYVCRPCKILFHILPMAGDF